MPQTAGSIVTSIARRVRDETNTAHTSAFVRSLIDRVQVILNAHQEYLISEATLNLTQGQALYTLESDLPGLIEITDVKLGDQSLAEIVPWRNLWKISNTWLTDRGTPIGWAKIGRSLLAIHPTPDSPVTITVTGTKITQAITSDDDIVELRDEDIDIVKEIVVTLLLLKQRDLDTAGIAAVRGEDKQRLQIEDFMERGLKRSRR